MTKLAIVTAVFGHDYGLISAVTTPTIKAWADRSGADLVLLNRRMYPHLHVHWEKFQISQLLKTYDRVCWVDNDIVVNPKAPSIFSATDPVAFAAFEEGKVFGDRVNFMASDADYYGIKMRPERGFSYFNAGVMVMGQQHTGIYVLPTAPKAEPMSEQTYTNLQVMRLGLHFQDLTSKWNGLHSYHGHGDRRDLWTVHYAGYPKTADWVSKVIDEMKRDLAAFR
jgi:hypothetical protein